METDKLKQEIESRMIRAGAKPLVNVIVRVDVAINDRGLKDKIHDVELGLVETYPEVIFDFFCRLVPDDKDKAAELLEHLMRHNERTGSQVLSDMAEGLLKQVDGE